MTEYVVGFLFNTKRNLVILIEKQRPDWMKGKWNGVGGHVEAGETPLEAMRREFQEEAGLDIENWEMYATLNVPLQTATVYAFRAFSDSWPQMRSMTDELVLPWTLEVLPMHPLMTNARWLIPMALSMDEDSAAAFEIKELY